MKRFDSSRNTPTAFYDWGHAYRAMGDPDQATRDLSMRPTGCFHDYGHSSDTDEQTQQRLLDRQRVTPGVPRLPRRVSQTTESKNQATNYYLTASLRSLVVFSRCRRENARASPK